MALPTRKHPRLKNYDYSQCGCYHITFCVKNRMPILSSILPAATETTRATVQLTQIGSITEQYIRRIADVYKGPFILQRPEGRPPYMSL